MKEMTQHSLIQTYSAINPLLPCQYCSVTYLKQHSSHSLPLLQNYSFHELCRFLTYKSRNLYEATSCMLSVDWVISNQSLGEKSYPWATADNPVQYLCPNTYSTREQRDRIHGWKWLARKELECWWGYIVHSNPAQMIIKTTVQIHPTVNGCCKGVKCHYRTNCWAPKPENSFWPWVFAFCPVQVPEHSPGDTALKSGISHTGAWKSAKIHQSD